MAPDEQKKRVIVAQFDDFDIVHRDTVWLPRMVAKVFQWDMGDVGASYEMSSQARIVLGITEQQQRAAEDQVNQFLAQIRATEAASVVVIQNNAQSALLKIPATINFASEKLRFEADLSGILGKEAATLLMPKLYKKLDKITSLTSGEEKLIRVKLVDDSRITVETEQGSWTTQENALPQHLAHLFKIGRN